MSYIFITLGATALAYYMAKERGRDTTLAVAGGLLFGLLCPLYYWIAGDSKELRKAKLRAEIAAESNE